MIKYTLSVLCFIFSLSSITLSASTYEIPDLELIKQAVLDTKSPYYYPRLMKRYNLNDTTLTLQDFRHLYLGYSYQEGYNPYRLDPFSDKIKLFVDKKEISASECDSIIKYARKSIENSPFDIRPINMLIYAYKNKSNFVEKQNWSYKMKGIIDAILSTGDGLTKETAYYVISTADEYAILSLLGLNAQHQKFIQPDYDNIEVKPNPYKVEGYYFNVKRMLDAFERKFGE